MIQVQVTDIGTGMNLDPPALRPKKRLWVSFVNQLGGSLTAQSEEIGSGLVFTLNRPVAPMEQKGMS